MVKKKKRKCKNIFKFLVLIFIVIIFVSFIFVNGKPKRLVIEEEIASLDEYYIYGTYLSLFGSLDDIDIDYDYIDLVLYDGDFYSYDLIVENMDNGIEFSLSDTINTGMYLDDISKGDYNLFIRLGFVNEDLEYDYKYYAIENNTSYEETVYYTLSTYNNKIVINTDDDYQTLTFNVMKNTDSNIYDIVIDPGHGGIDSGATSKGYTEDEINMEVSNYIYDYLVEAGYKVKLTREENDLSSDDYFDEYNDGGRAVISHEVSAKYVISIHCNSSDSSSVRGVELYTASGIDYTFANALISNIISDIDIDVSSRDTYKIYDGIYTHNFTEDEILDALLGYDAKGYNRYNVTTDSNYLYMIRETGGIMTGAYVDDSNEDEVGTNPYYDSNIGAEAYLLELGYMTNYSDLIILTSETKSYAKSISDSIINELLK